MKLIYDLNETDPQENNLLNAVKIISIFVQNIQWWHNFH
jgi:hypothetical protein